MNAKGKGDLEGKYCQKLQKNYHDKPFVPA